MQKNTERGGERGSALIVFAMALTAIIGFCSLTIDLGIGFQQRRGLQNAVDAAALAGASQLPGSPSLAQSLAQQWASNNGIGAGDALSVTIKSTYVTNDTIVVSATRTETTQFAKVLSVGSYQISAQATALIGSPAGMNRFIPLAALQSVVSGLKSGDTLALKYDSQTQTNGNSLALSFPGSSGGSDFQNNIINGSAQTFCIYGEEYPGCTSSINTEPGNMVGPTKQGINSLIQGTSSTCDTYSKVFTTDPNNPAKILINNQCNPFPPYNASGSERILLVPVIDSLCNGNCTVHIVNFAMMFLNGIQCNGGQGSCQVTGQFVAAAFDLTTAVQGPYNGQSAFAFARLVQ